jgi:mannose-1-phosphate guanylyltransferase
MAPELPSAGEGLERKPLARAGGPSVRRDGLWAIVLAGGEGVRLRPLVRRICGDERPKQYAPLVSGRSLLEATLARAALAVSAEHTIVVAACHHSAYLEGFCQSPRPRVLLQPDDRGTAAGVLYPAHHIAWQDPSATVVVLPSDHFVSAERVFMDHVRSVATMLETCPDHLVLLGARPSGPEVEYGWIEPGEPLAGGPVALRAVRRFLEKPAAEVAEACLARGWLWNTLVLVTRVSTLIEASRIALPALHERFARLRRFAGTADEAWAVRQAYAHAPRASFSSAVLEPLAARLAVSPLPADLVWSDWGTPRRVLATVQALDLTPPWRETLEALMRDHEDATLDDGRAHAVGAVHAVRGAAS